MQGRKPWIHALCALALLLAPAQALLAAPGSRAAFDKAVKDLKSDPSNTALRKKIFKLSRELSSLPDTPDDVAILKGKAAYIVKNANSSADYGAAVDAYQEATNIAPWIPELYYNLGVVQEKAGQPTEAAESFKLYLAADPEAEDRGKVLARLGALEVQQEKRVQSTQQVQAQSQVSDSQALKRWEDQRTGAVVVGVLSAIFAGLGAVLMGVGMGDQSTVKTSSVKTSTYNIYYGGRYYTSAGYDKYTAGEGEVIAGATFLGLGLLGVIVAVAMDPGPKPKVALLELDGDKFAFNAPSLDLNPDLGGVNTTLLHLEF